MRRILIIKDESMRSSHLNLRQVLAGVARPALFAILSTVVPLAAGGNAKAQTALNLRAGFAGFPKGKAGFTITFSSPMPNANYTVSLQQTNAGAYSTVNGCTYFNVLHLTVNGFDVQHKKCFDGMFVNTKLPPGGVTLGYIAVGP